MSTIWEVSESISFTPSTLPYSHLLQKLLALRGLTAEEEIGKHLFPLLEHLNNPSSMKGINESVKRILSAIERKETILIHGDYDVDGITGAALLSRMFEKLNARFITFLPNRKRDGYGVSAQAVQLAKEKNVSLFITVDCGITAFEEAKEAKTAGIDVIIIDHHRIHDTGMPEAYAIINPLQDGCQYPFKELSACGLAFKLAQALLGAGAFELLDLVALSSVCDIAPLTHENRILVYYGLKRLGCREQIGFKSLCQSASLKRPKISTSDLGFILGPRINASGRMGSPETALKLLTTKDPKEADMLSQILDSENKARQKEERWVLKQALQTVEREINFNRDRIVVVSGDGWHEGVIGIVAQRLVEYFGRPAVVITFDGAKGKGSGRSMKGFHLFDSFSFCEEFLEEFGGHELAAGLSIKKERFPEFRKKMNEFAKNMSLDVFTHSIRVDLEINLRELSSAFLRELSLLEPFGAGNPKPKFLTKNLKTKKGPEHLNGGGYRWWVTDGEMTFEAVWRSRAKEIIFPEKEPYQIVYSPKLSSWDGIDSVILEVKDVKAEA